MLWAGVATSPLAEEPSAGGFVVRDASTHLSEGVYRLNASIDYRLSPAVREALENGVPLTVEIQIEVRRDRWYWLDEEVAVLNQYYLLQYHALSRQYLLTSLNSGKQRSFSTLRSALEAMGSLVDIPILDSKLLRPETEYQVRLRALLDIESLPAPLRPVAYLSDEWRLVSEWYSWPLSS
ncbi:MAG: hypothetical protein Kow006_17010 [Gammaproteobacteria bacterium]